MSHGIFDFKDCDGIGNVFMYFFFVSFLSLNTVQNILSVFGNMLAGVMNK